MMKKALSMALALVALLPVLALGQDGQADVQQERRYTM